MKLKIFSALAILTLLGTVACSSTPEAPAAPATPTPKYVSGKGTISVLPKGAGFVIDAEDGKKYLISNPDKLDKSLRKAGTKVQFSGKALTNENGNVIEIEGVTLDKPVRSTNTTRNTSTPPPQPPKERTFEK